MKKRSLIVPLLVAAAWLGVTTAADAANESIGLSLEATPGPGGLYREVPRPIGASLTVTVTVPSESPKVTPIKVANVTFPSDMDFFPDPKKTPACPDSVLNQQTNLAAGIAAIVSLCPDSVIGTGTSVVKLGKVNSPLTTLIDPRLVIFNAGRSSKGRPKIVIYGYSKTVNAGLLMHGTLASDGQLRIEIGVMPFDSAISEFTLGIPGEALEVPDDSAPGGTTTVRGLDPAYLRGRCSTGTWRATGKFVLGERSDPSGVPIGEETLLSSNPFELPCEGKAGRAKLAIDAIKGPKNLRPGHKSEFVLTIRNPGTATARNLAVAAKGAATGTGKPGSLGPGKSIKVRLPVIARSRKGSGKIRFLVSANDGIRKQSVRKAEVG
jgi:hypothetical protein